MRACVRVLGQDTVRVWRSEDNLRCSPQAPSAFGLRKGDLTGLERPHPGRARWPADLTLGCTPQLTGSQGWLAHHVPVPAFPEDTWNRALDRVPYSPVTNILRQKFPVLFLETQISFTLPC